MAYPSSPPEPSYIYADSAANGHDLGGARTTTFPSTALMPRSRRRLELARPVGDLFIFLTGADRTKVGPPTERHRYITIGLLMVVTTVQAWYSATLFMSIGLGKPFTKVFGFGIFFAVAVYLIDRSIIGFAPALKKDKNDNLLPPRKANWVLGIRIVIAIAAALLMSELILLQVFAKDIQQQIQSDQLAATGQASSQVIQNYQARIRALEAPIKQDQKIVDARQATVSHWYKQVNCQEFGCPGIPAGEDAGFRNAQINLANARNALNQAQRQLQDIRRTDNPLIDKLEKAEQQAITHASSVIANANVVLTREEAFTQLSLKYGAVMGARVLLSLLILGIDLAPILTKVTGRASKHDLADQNAYVSDLTRGQSVQKTEEHRSNTQGDLDRRTFDAEVATALWRVEKGAEVERARITSDADLAMFKIDFDAQAAKRAYQDGDEAAGKVSREQPAREDAMRRANMFAAAPIPLDVEADQVNPPGREEPMDHEVGNDDRADPDGRGKGNAGFRPANQPRRTVDVFADVIFFQQHPPPRGIKVLADRWALVRHLEGAEKGGGGTVWQATDLRGEPGWFVAKTTPSGSMSMETTGRLAEIALFNEQRTQDIVSSHIGKIVDFGEDQGLSFIIYPLYKPGSLYRYCRNLGQPLALSWCAGLIDQVLSGLIDAADYGLIHLDIKPSNIVLDGPRARIIDWGLSRAWLASQPYTSVPRGSAFFACPEQLIRRSRGWDTPLADLYSVGATFYWLLAGEAPLRYSAGVRDDLLTYRNLLAGGVQPQPVHELVRGIPRPLSDLIDRWLSYEPRDRVPQGTSLSYALRVSQDELRAMRPFLPDMQVGHVTGRRRKRRRRGRKR